MNRKHPAIRPDSRLTPELIRDYHTDGAWCGRPLRALLDDAAQRFPHRLAAVNLIDGWDAGAYTYRELDTLTRRYAAGLRRLGVREGDVVAVMLHNGVDYTALVFAIAEIGAVYTGIPITYGLRETETILRRSRATVIVAAAGYRGTDLLGPLLSLRPRLPYLRKLVIAGGPVSGQDVIRLSELGPDGPASRPTVAPEALAHIGFTSGTTGDPKGVMNSHETLQFVIRRWVDHVGDSSLGTPPVNLVASPMGHHTGFVWGALLTTYLGGTAVYLDRWDPERAASAVVRHRVSVLFGAPVFLQDLLRTKSARQQQVTSLQMVVVAGAPVPRALPEEASRLLGCYVCPAWGMTEYAIGISCSPGLPPAAQRTDGLPVSGCEVRVVRADGSDCRDGEPGDLQIRGGGLFLGYFEQPEETRAAMPDGWFLTGDTAARHPDGLISLHGRRKDIVIRGGENIPVVLVESLLHDHPDVVEAAVVGVPDSRLGERVCAVVVAEAGMSPTLGSVKGFLLDRGLSRHFLPERLEVVEALPKTASGKVRKVELRARYAAPAG